MTGEKAPVSFESVQSKIQTLLGLSAVQSVDLLDTINALEKSGTEIVNRDPAQLARLAEWMVYALDGAGHMNTDGKVQPPLENSVVADFQSKRVVYSNFLKSYEPEAKAEEPSQPDRTSDRKA